MTRRLVPILLLPLAVACGGPDDDRNQPMFTSGSGGSETLGTDSDSMEAGSMSNTGDGDGDGDPGDGDGGPGDGDGNPGDGDGGPGDGDGGPGDGDGAPGCMTDPSMVGSSCGEGDANYGTYGLGQMNTDMPIGAIPDADNGLGNGAEDWYQVGFPIDPNNPRPTGGMATISFALNENNDYRFEVYRDCGAQVYGQGLATEFGGAAPPLTEWSFNDLDPMEEQLNYTDNVIWPTNVWIRVFRFANDGACSSYQLQIMRN